MLDYTINQEHTTVPVPLIIFMTVLDEIKTPERSELAVEYVPFTFTFRVLPFICVCGELGRGFRRSQWHRKQRVPFPWSGLDSLDLTTLLLHNLF